MTGGDHGLGGPVLDLQAGSYDAVRAQFRWPLPDRFNIAEACCLRHARGPRRDAPALIFTDGGAEPETVSFAALAREASRFANVLRGHDIGPGSVVALHLPQRREAVVAHVGIQMVGAIALPLFGLFGPDAVRFRLADSAARMLVSTQAGLARIAEALDGHACLKTIVAVDAPAAGGPGGAVSFAALMDRASEREACLATSRDAPAFLMYTSGTTGDPKGVLHGQRVLLGHLPGIVLPHEGFPSPGDRFWTPADWAWAGGLFDALLPSLFYGVPVVGSARRFDPAWARELVAAQNVRNAFIPPTALRLMRGEGVYPERGALRTIGTGGEALGEEMIAWGQDALGVSINEFYGQTEVNLVVGNCASLYPIRAGSMGRALPGHDVAIVDEHGAVLGDDAEGIVAVRRPNPVMFLSYWRNPQATEDKFRGDWCLLGDVARRDAEGYFWFRGRDDDIILSAGYRIGPSEIEDCLMSHPAVMAAGVVGAPDAVRGEMIVAFVVVRAGTEGDDSLAAALSAHVRERLGPHQYPREVRFIDQLPMTLTGKVKRRDLRARARCDAPA